MTSARSHLRLRRELGTFGAVMTGLGAMIGTGVFVSIGLGAGIAGPAVLLALALAAGVALCNGLSSAQLAAAHPVSGGTYEYGHTYLNPWAGFAAGWMFLVAKSASAATAALGFSGYLLQMLGAGRLYLVPTALGTVAVLAWIVLAGIRRSHAANVVIVSVSLLALLFFVAVGLPAVDSSNFVPFFARAESGGPAPGALLEATALMFVAYTGYARIATLGEEVLDPSRIIPRAIVSSGLVVMVIYLAVAGVAVGVAGSEALLDATERATAPLAVVAARLSPLGGEILAIGALAAMLGVLLNLILGLSRVVLAMARRGDLFATLGTLDASGTTPRRAVFAVAIVVAAIAATGDFRAAWSFSAFSVLVYYSLTNLCALRLPPAERRYPRWIAGVGLACCFALAFFVETRIWLAGIGLLLVGFVWRAAVRLGARRAGERKDALLSGTVYDPPESVLEALGRLFDGAAAVRAVQVVYRPAYVDAHLFFIGGGRGSVTRPGRIYTNMPAEDFFDHDAHVLHEFYHVIEQWGRARMTIPGYLSRARRREAEARAFVERTLMAYCRLRAEFAEQGRAATGRAD